MIRTAFSVFARLVAAVLIILAASLGLLATAGISSPADMTVQLQTRSFSWLPDLRLGIVYFLLGCAGSLIAVALLAFAPSLGNRLQQMRLEVDLDELRKQQDMVVQMRLAVMENRTELTREQTRLIVGLNMLGRDIDRLAGDLRDRMYAERRWLFMLSLPSVLVGGVLAVLLTGLAVAGRLLPAGAMLLQAVFFGALWIGLATVVDVLRTATLKVSMPRPVPSYAVAERVAAMDFRFQSNLDTLQRSVVDGHQVVDAQLQSIADRLSRLEQSIARIEPPPGNLSALPGLTMEHARLLRQAGINSQAELLRKGASPDARRQLETRTGLSHSQLLRWYNYAELLQIEDFTPEHAELLQAAGVTSLRELAQRNPAYLHARLAEANNRQQLVTPTPTLKHVTVWIAAAKRLCPPASREAVPTPSLAPQG